MLTKFGEILRAFVLENTTNRAT